MVTARIVWLAMEDEGASQRLVEIARRHCKLVLEFGQKNTLTGRRKAIQAEIERLRTERARILKVCEAEERQWI